MKFNIRMITVFFLIITSFVVHAEEYIVQTKGSGLVLRERPSTSSSKVTVVQDGKRIKLIEKTGKKETISGKSGEWYKVSYNTIDGYCFSAFLILVGSTGNDESMEIKKFATNPFLGKDITQSGIEVVFGKPKRKELIKEIENDIDPGKKIKINNYVYEGVVFVIADVSTKKQLITKIIITNNSYKLSNSVKLGNTEEEIISILGQPAKTLSNQLTYEYADNSIGNVEIVFYLSNNKANKIEVTYYSD